MSYLKQTFDLAPAAYSTRDRFLDVVNDRLLPSNEKHGARLVGAWFAHENWFNQIVQVTEFDDLAAYGAYRQAVTSDGEAAEADAQLENLCEGREADLLEPLGPVPVETLHATITKSAEKPNAVYTFAILDVLPGKIEDFASLLSMGAANLPISAAWRQVTGPTNRIIDLWRTDTGAAGYEPDSPAMAGFFGPLRQVAPREKMMRLHVLPYSPLR